MLVVVEINDLVFAGDPITAVFGITTDSFLVYTSNICAILGPRDRLIGCYGSGATHSTNASLVGEACARHGVLLPGVVPAATQLADNGQAAGEEQVWSIWKGNARVRR